MDKAQEKKASGSRLKECMDAKGIKNGEMCAKMSIQFQDSFSEQYLAQMRSGSSAISKKRAFRFAEILEIDADYLLGKDGFKAASYKEYLQLIEDRSRFKDAISEMKKYDHYLECCGYYVVGSNGDGTQTTEYQIQRKRKSKDAPNLALIPADEMEQFKREVDKFIRLKMDALMMEHELHPF